MWNYSSEKICKIINDNINGNEWFIETMFLGGDVFTKINKTKKKVITSSNKNVIRTIKLFQEANLHRDVIAINQPYDKLILTEED